MLKKKTEDQDKSIKNLENERSRLLAKVDDLTYENNNCQAKLRSREDTLLVSQRQLEDTKTNLAKSQNKMAELESLKETLNNEIEKLKLTLNREAKSRVDSEKQNQELNYIIKERENEIRRLLEEFDSSKINNDKLLDDNQKLFAEIEKLKSHILLVTEQNSKLSDELDLFVEQDEKIRSTLNRRERIGILKKSNQFYLEKSLSKFDEPTNGDFNKKSNLNNSRNLSPNRQNYKEKI